MKEINYTNLNTYDYNLPEELIAQTPIEPRDSSRMAVYNRKLDTIEHKHFYDIENYLQAGDVLVINNTRVIPARLYGYKATGAKIETLLLKRHSLTVWECLMKPAKRLHIGDELVFNEELKCKLLEIMPDGNRKIEFIYNGVLEDILTRVGQMPLPPYIREKLKNQERYQTVYNKITGSAASPYSLYNEDIASFGDSHELYSHKDSEGFINLYGLPLKVRAMMLNKKGENKYKN